MSFEKNIEDLFQSEDLDKKDSDPVAEKAELPKLDLPPDTESGGLEKREFTRIDVKERQISVRFHNELHFAKHYMENISVGGLFVRTDDKYEMGALVPIEFEVKTSEFGEPELFQLKGKVCRITDNGVGLEFTNLDQVTRTRLESYVQSILPRGTNLRTKAKQSTIEKLEQMRQERAQKVQTSKKYAMQILALLCLALTNGLLVKQQLDISRSERVNADQSIEIQGKKIKWNEIRSLEQTNRNETVVKTASESFTVNTNDLEMNLPPHLKHQFQILKSTPPKKPIRRPKNSGRLSNIRERFKGR